MKPIHRYLVLSCGLLVAAWSPFSMAGDPPASLPAAMDLILKENRPSPAMEMLRSGVESGSIPSTAAAQFYALSGDSAGTLEMYDRSAVPFEVKGDAPDLSKAKLQPALAAIVRASAGKLVVMLNEDHYHQQHRAFGLQVLKALRAAGFTHFGAETFGPAMRDSMSDGAPDLRTGVYTADPLYADMVRQAAASGYTLFDYEQRPDQESNQGTPEDQRLVRERAQAQNIAAVLKADPAARLLIYAGASHIAEVAGGGERKWMAQILKEDYGIDPLTVNQVLGTPRSRADLDGTLYQAVSRKFKLSRPSVVSVRGKPLNEPGFDLVVFLPREQTVQGRADWMAIGGYRRPCRIEVTASPQPSMVRAFVSTEDSASIPMDQVRVGPSEADAMLLLPAGAYRLIRETASGDTVLGQGLVSRKGRSADAGNLCLPPATAP